MSRKQWMNARAPLAPIVSLVSLAAIAALGSPGCSDTLDAPNLSTLDRPSEIAFACFGLTRLTAGADVASDPCPPTPDGTCACDASVARTCEEERLEAFPQVFAPLPPEACGLLFQEARNASDSSRRGGQGCEADPCGAEGTPLEDAVGGLSASAELVGFVLQKATGTVAVVRGQVAQLTASLPPGVPSPVSVIDADTLSPGENGVPVGTLPVGIATDPTSCHVMTANAGSCDLTLLDVNDLLDTSARPSLRRLPLHGPGDVRIGARPHALAGQVAAVEPGFECQPDPASVVYIAFPDCHAVGVVEAATGALRAGITFADDGTVAITADLPECQGTCGLLVPPSETAARPVALEVQADGQRLYVGADNRPEITIVDLDPAGLPVATAQVVLEGDIGITSLAATAVIGMGGEGGSIVDGGGGPHRFVYAVATDGTVRVADVLDKNHECDTQVDPRFLYEIRDVGLLSCVPIDPIMFPRRLGATSPGIAPPGGIPLDVAFATVDSGVGDTPTPTDLVGTFAFITVSAGGIAVANVDDDHIRDFENTGDPLATDMTLSIAHQLRDTVLQRESVRDQTGSCSFPSPNPGQLGPRLSTAPVQTIQTDVLVPEKAHMIPSTRSLLCQEDVDPDPNTVELSSTSVPELSFMAPVAVRERAFPDLGAVRNQESWRLVWEGRISDNEAETGPRRGYVTSPGQGAFTLNDGGRPFCKIGVEAFDAVTLQGCDPAGNQCGIGETCFVHPDTPDSVTTGMCLPDAEAQLLADPCRDLLISRRRFSVRQAFSDRLVLGERRRVLRTTPVGGCTSAEQCVQLHDVERALAVADHPRDLELPASPHAWSCEPDPTRAPAPDRCVMTCAAAADCEEGFQCSGGYCVEAAIPPAQCVQALQRYDVRVTDAFAVIGESTGFLHARVVDPATGECTDDPLAHPLAVGRVPLEAPACVSDDRTELSPNPCATVVDHTAPVVVYDAPATCGGPGLVLQTRQAPALRLQNPAFTLHLVDPVTAGDSTCNGDRAGQGPLFPAVFPDYQIAFTVIGGFDPMTTILISRGLRHPRRIVPGLLGELWIMDEGDVSRTVRGQVLHIAPDQAQSGFSARVIL